MADLWYFTCEDKQMEPVTSAELKQLVSSGFVRRNDLVWKEGMSAWTKAGELPELMSIAAAAPAPAAHKRETPRSRPMDDDLDEPRPRRRRRSEEDDDRDWDDDRPRRRRDREPAKGMSGLTLGLIIGGSVLAVLVLVIIGVAFASRRPPNVVVQQPNNAPFQPVIQKNLPGANLPIVGPTAVHQILNVEVGKKRQISVPFPKTKMIQVSLTSNEPGNDVNLSVIDSRGLSVATDVSVGPDSRLSFLAQANQRYVFRVDNLGPNPCNCILIYTQP